MEWKKFGMKRKLVSARQIASKVLRLMSSLQTEGSSVSSPTPAITAAPFDTANSLASYSLEAELKRAQALAYWQRWENRPK